jgi:hypothetical protein
MTFEGGLFVKGVEAKGDITNREEDLKEAFELGRNAVLNKTG